MGAHPPRARVPAGARRWICAIALTLAGALLPRGAEAPSAPPRLGTAAPNFALTTQQDDRLWLTQLRGRVVVLTFACTTCQACPGLLPSLAEVSRSLADTTRHRVFFVAVSADPHRDTAAVLRRFARDRSLDLTVWVLLTGRPAEIDVVARWYGVEVRRENGRVTHGCLLTLIDARGVVRARYTADEIGRLREEIDALLGESG